MPSFLPIRPIIRCASLLKLYFDINSSSQLELSESINCLLRWIKNIEYSLVGADLKLFARFFIHMRRAVHSKSLYSCWQRDWSGHPSTSALHRLDDFLHRSV